ncbi:MAG: DUF4282 domain-containing protein [Planctomycetota bacterium]|jgi:hypothetical protein|nr:DUF4282 domain-containing protein [Planctomycetota bacterium]
MDVTAGGTACELGKDASEALREIRKRGVSGFFRFDKMYFPVIARFVFVLKCVVIALMAVAGALGGVVTMLGGSILAGLGVIVVSIFGGIIVLIVVRISFEMFLIAFNINENLEAIGGKLGQ